MSASSAKWLGAYQRTDEGVGNTQIEFDVVQFVPKKDRCTAMHLSPDNKVFMSKGAGVVEEVDSVSGATVREYKHDLPRFEVTKIGVFDSTLVFLEANRIRLITRGDFTELQTHVPVNKGLLSSCMSFKEGVVVTCHEDKTLRGFTVDSLSGTKVKAKWSVKVKGDASPLFCDEETGVLFYLAGSALSAVNVATGKPVPSACLQPQNSNVVSGTCGQGLVVLATQFGGLEVWNMSGAAPALLCSKGDGEIHEDLVHTCTILSPTTLATTSIDEQGWLLDARTLEKLCEFKPPEVNSIVELVPFRDESDLAPGFYARCYAGTEHTAFAAKIRPSGDTNASEAPQKELPSTDEAKEEEEGRGEGGGQRATKKAKTSK